MNDLKYQRNTALERIKAAKARKTTPEGMKCFEHITIPVPLSDLFKADDNALTAVYQMRKTIAETIIATINQPLIDFTRAYMEENQINDCYIVDKEFLESAILHELERRIENGTIH